MNRMENGRKGAREESWGWYRPVSLTARVRGVGVSGRRKVEKERRASSAALTDGSNRSLLFDDCALDHSDRLRDGRLGRAVARVGRVLKLQKQLAALGLVAVVDGERVDEGRSGCAEFGLEGASPGRSSKKTVRTQVREGMGMGVTEGRTRW